MRKHEIKHILVIRFRRVGDSVLAMSLCESLHQSFPEAQIDYVLNEAITPLYEGHPALNRVIPFSEAENHHIFSYLRKVWKLMHATRYDAIIDMRSTVKTLFFSLFSLHTPYRIGRKKGYNHFIQNFRIVLNENTDRITSNFSLMKPLEREANLVYDRHFRLFITEKEKVDFRAYMQRQGIDFERPVILTAVATRIPQKAWNETRMTEILRRLIEQHDAQLVFNYAGEAEAQTAKRYAEALGNSPHIFLNIEAKTLRELCALCANSHFFFGNEGGPRHIAQAFDVPSLAIYPPNTSKTQWLPDSGTRFRGLSPDDFLAPERQQAMDYGQRFALIGVEDVWRELDAMLREYVK